ncbi:carbon storage regulator [Tepidibacter thalassicus]|uniref:Carbon storage regulator, CsrA n=1 Tax=Tepidibacter thalassicus DSM 15285 TaxID=1123350 RepID=A0A1M5R2F3_9FIRM|nr:carbon storage regulator [Tepidibacter thalassicus]SHH20567.1 carbon storage regulator, CsrA [Tepidibacter thalassicus DSM 15285]
MLVLGRKIGEYVVIGGMIKVKVIEGGRGRLRLAIDAPKDMDIIRGEKWEKQKRKFL